MRVCLLALSLATICTPGVALAQSDKAPDTSQQTSRVLLAQAQNQEFEVYFPLGKSTLSADASTTIAQAAQEYQRTGQAKIAVRGHTDTSGSTERNQVLSERRAKAVTDELVRLGVPADAITQEALGETDLAVQTPKGVREAKNRRVQIIVEAPPPPPPPAPAPAPAPQVTEAPPPPPPPAPKRGLLSIGPFYGYVTGNGHDNTSHLAGLNFSIDYAVLPWLGIGAEQAGFYNFDDEHKHRHLASRSAGSLNLLLGHYSMGDMDVVPYVGGNFGYATSKGIHDDLFAGPELGVFVGPFIGKAAYDIPLHEGMDGGNLAVTLGIGLSF
jgi:outer membrane protein OmpA-like peptidoglycan-associated protein